MRCALCLKQGAWPQRLHDVEELESVLKQKAAARQQGGAS
jgi:hypothetical protein